MFGRSGSKRVTAQGMLAPSNTPLRIYNVVFMSTASDSSLVIANAAGTATATGTSCTAQLQIPASKGWGTWNGGQTGMRFDDGVFVQTSANFSFAVITFNKEA